MGSAASTLSLATCPSASSFCRSSQQPITTVSSSHSNSISLNTRRFHLSSFLPSSLCSSQLPPPAPCRPAQLEDYEIGSVVGRGGFGKIREIKRLKDERWFALKIFEFERLNQSLAVAELILTELTALSRLPHHPFLVRLYSTFRDSSSLSFVLDLFPGGDLRLLLRLHEQFTEAKTAYVIACIGSALHHLHLHRMIHRDIKPENIMFDCHGVPKLIDFGISYLSPLPGSGGSGGSSSGSGACVCESRSGTSQYMAPENFVYQTHFHSFESDFWSLGAVMFEMLFYRLFDLRVPSAFVKYSHLTYQAAWKAFLGGASAGSGSGSVRCKSQSVTPKSVLRTDCEFFPTDSSARVTLAGPRSYASAALPSTMTEFFPLFQETTETEGPSPDEAPRLTIPSCTSFDTSPSAACSSLLSSLLDVRLHKRVGVGVVNYGLFERHQWFKQQGVDVKSVHRQASPISPDFEEVSTLIWQKHFDTNLEDSDRAVAAVAAAASEEQQQQQQPVPDPGLAVDGEGGSPVVVGGGSTSSSASASPQLSEEVLKCLEQVPLLLSAPGSLLSAASAYHETNRPVMQEILARQRAAALSL
jgi:serine/threonine protein kinase